MKSSESAPRPGKFSERTAVAMKHKLSEAESAVAHDLELSSAYEIAAEGKTLTGYAADHLNDPANPMFADLKTVFEGAKPEVVIIEGIAELEKHLESFRRDFAQESEEETIRKMGEPGLMLRLALERGIEVVSPEMPGTEEIRVLLARGFSEELIFAFYFFRGVNGFTRRVANDETSEARIERGLKAFASATQWEGFDYSFEHANRLSMKYWGVPVSQDPGFYNEKVSHWGKERLGSEYSIVNEVSAALNEVRDKNIVAATAQALDRHDSVMVVYGASHMIELRPVFERLLKVE